MAWNITKNKITGKSELVINGFEQGIADSPFEGIADIRNYNITSSPKQASVEFAMAGVTLPPTGFTTTAFTAVAGTNVFTTASVTGFYAGMGLTINTFSGTGLTNGITYYVGSISGTTFKLYVGMDIQDEVDVTGDGSGTFTVQTFGTPSDFVSAVSNTFIDPTGENVKHTFIMTLDGLVWYLTALPSTRSGGTRPRNTLQFLGNLVHSTAGTLTQTGIVVFKGYLIVFEGSDTDYLPITAVNSNVNPAASWVYSWQTTVTSFVGHRAIAATDDAVYFCNDDSVGSIIEVAGSTFDPTSSATFTFNNDALLLPSFDKATCLAQLGTNLLVGGIFNNVYPWDRISTSFAYPLIVAEQYIKCIVSTNSNAFIFAGNRGRIYITNGSNIDRYKKFPDYLSNIVNPYYTWGWAIYFKDQLFFSISATNNSLTTISNFAGVWSYDLKTEALRLSNSLSYGTYAGTVPVIVPMGSPLSTGEGIYAGWLNSTGGIDYTSASPYINYEARIDTDIIPVGTFLSPETFSNIEFKLAKPLVAGEVVRISQRSNLTSSFVDVPVTQGGSTGDMSGVCSPINFQNVQWVQLRIESSSTATTPSYVPLTEIIIGK
jgi:hypothetical protein